MAKGKDFMNDLEEMDNVKGGLSSLMEQPAQRSTSTPPLTPQKKEVKIKQKKARVSYYIDEAINDQLKDFIVFQRTAKNKPYFGQSEAVEEGLKLLFEAAGYATNQMK